MDVVELLDYALFGGLIMSANNLENSYNSILDFISNDNEKTVLIKGTHQYKKHTLVLKVLEKINELKKGVFRINGLDNVALFLSHAGYGVSLGKKFRTGQEYNIGSLRIYIDSLFTQATWNKSPTSLDFMLIYPMDSFCSKKSEVKQRLLDDLYQHRDIGKIFIVTWTDIRHDYSWLDDIIDRTVIYDAEEEDFDYHKRVKSH